MKISKINITPDTTITASCLKAVHVKPHAKINGKVQVCNTSN
jgi:uncharacterized protein YlzI (FlbEa/FlbD family)